MLIAMLIPTNTQNTHVNKFIRHKIMLCVMSRECKHGPLKAFALVQRAQRCVRVPLMQVDGSSHQQEGGVGHVHALTHFLIQLSHDAVPAQSISRRY